jgi:chitodextrinase
VAIAVGGTQVELNWTASTDYVGVTGYLLERQDPGNSGFAQIATVAGTNYFDTGLVGPTNYNYRVRATDVVGNLSAYSPVASVTTLPGAVASDNFNRPDGPLGTNWSKPSVSTNDLVVVDDQVGVAVGDSHTYAFWSATNFDDDQYSQAQITTIGPWTGVILRADAVQDRFYIGFVFAPNDYRIYSRWDGAYYSLATGSSETWQVGDILRLEVRGSVDPVTITMYRNGVAVLSWVSTGSGMVRTGGSPGLGIYSPTGMNLTMDNWEGGNLSAGSMAPFWLTSIVQQGNDMLLTWTTVGGKTNVLQAANGTADGGFSNNFTDIFTVTNTISTVTNYLDAGAATNFPARYYRVRLLP